MNRSRCHTHCILCDRQKTRITNNLVSHVWHLSWTAVSDGDEEVCGSAEIKVALDYFEWTMYSSTGKVFCFCFWVFFFLFVHVAQLSIALGRHTLPHVKVWKGLNNGGKSSVCIYDAMLRTNLWFRLCCCLSCWCYTNLCLKWENEMIGEER